MDRVVRLRHAIRKGDWMMYFYDGELPVKDSTLTIPADRPEWIGRAWMLGFRMTAEGRVIADLAKHIRAETQDNTPAPEDDEVEHDVTDPDFIHTDSPDCPCLAVENAKSDEEIDTDEGAADRGQPVEDDRVRTREPRRRRSLPEGEVASRGSDEPADGGDGDESAD